MKRHTFKHIKSHRLRFPQHLKFTNAENGLLTCNGKLVQDLASLPINPEDNPTVDFAIFGIGKYKFILSEADVLIFSFGNIQTQKTDCVVIPRNELLDMLKDFHINDDQINLKLILSERSLHEYKDIGSKGWFMSLWPEENRNLPSFHNKWSAFSD